MTSYLLVAHQTAHGEELLPAAKEPARQDPDAEFVLLVPATPVTSLLVREEGETADVARLRGARTSPEDGGLRVIDADQATKTGGRDRGRDARGPALRIHLHLDAAGRHHPLGADGRGQPGPSELPKLAKAVDGSQEAVAGVLRLSAALSEFNYTR